MPYPRGYKVLKDGKISAKEATVRDGVACVAYFDSGMATKQGMAGFMGYGLNGERLVRAVLWLEKTWTTNNEAEM